MTEPGRALVVALAIHLLPVLALTASLRLGADPGPGPEPVLAVPEDLLDDGAGGPAPAAAPALSGPAPAAPEPVRPAAREPLLAPPEAAPVLSREASAAPVAATAPAGAATGGSAAPGPGPAAVGPGSAAGTGTGTGTGAGPGPGGGLEVLRQIYRKEHFAYIQARVAGFLAYPAEAARAGWSGRVQVGFLVQEDGTVAELALVRSSGVALLDREALAAVRRAAPLPRPPVAARLVLPIEFELE